MNDNIEKEQSIILEAFIKNVPFDGWSNSSLNKAAKECNYDASYVSLLFPNGIEDLTDYFVNSLNAQMTEKYINNSEATKLKISDKISYLIELKFSLYQPMKEAIRCLFQYNLLPQNICSGQTHLWKICDQIWYLAGDKSTDFNYYTKRSLLAYVYSSSLLYYLSDESENFLETKNFIKRKIESVLKLGKWKASSLKFLKNLFNAKL